MEEETAEFWHDVKLWEKMFIKHSSVIRTKQNNEMF